MSLRSIDVLGGTLSASTEVSHGDGYDEWLGLKCANGAVGWILARDLENMPEFASATIESYGSAEDEANPSAHRTYLSCCRFHGHLV